MFNLSYRFVKTQSIFFKIQTNTGSKSTIETLQKVCGICSTFNFKDTRNTSITSL